MTTDTSVFGYWWNWRFLICAVFLSSCMAAAAVLISKYEGCKKSRRERWENQHDTVGSLYENEAWTTSIEVIHPAWLLVYRVIAFIVLLSLIATNIAFSGVDILFFLYSFYSLITLNRWTFCLVTIYFALATSLSLYGYCRKHNRVGDQEQGIYVAPMLGESADTSDMSKRFADETCPSRKAAGVYVYTLQVIYQMCGGSVVLTDVVFWLVLYPFLTSRSYNLNFMMVSMHSFNVVFFLGETLLNNLRFPMFRISYFVLWTGIFVIYQLIIHACKSMWWPYPFLELASPYAPLWYLGVGLMHIPCYGVFALIIKLKQLCLLRSFPKSFQGEM